MRLFIAPKLKDNPVMKRLIAGFLLLTALHAVSRAVLFAGEHGPVPSGVARSFLGDEAAFVEGKTLVEALEESHVDLFLAAAILLCLTALFALTDFPAAWKPPLIAGAYAAAALDATGGPLILWLGPAWAWAKWGGFWLFEAMTAFFIVSALKWLWKRDGA